MALYTIGDLHLSFSSNKPMDKFGGKWKDHADKLKQNFASLSEDDVCVLCGDSSWGMTLEESREDFAFINALPGKKIILKGNHDYWWTTAKKMNDFFHANGFSTLHILNNNSYLYEEIAICGTRGWFYEEETGGAHDKKIMNREILRLKTSLDSAGDREKIVFLHYPPIYQNYRCEEIIQLLQDYGVRRCYYGHIHAKGCAFAFSGWSGRTEFQLISSDHIDFKPIQIHN